MQQKPISQQTNQSINESFRQKSAGVSLVVLSTLGIYYLLKILEFVRVDAPFQTEAGLPSEFAGLAITVLVFILVLEVMLKIVPIVNADSVLHVTRRDRDAARKAHRIAYWVLSAGILLTFGSVILGVNKFITANIAMLSLLRAEITKFALQLYFYRQSV